MNISIIWTNQGKWIWSNTIRMARCICRLIWRSTM